MRRRGYCVAPQAREPSHAAKHLNVPPSDAQSVSIVHGFVHALAPVVHPASVKAPRARQERPAAQSESALHAVPATFSEGLLQAKNAAKTAIEARTRTVRMGWNHRTPAATGPGGPEGC